MCTESPLDPFPPSDILGHDLDWLASTAKKGRERDLANELPVGEAKRESSKEDKCRQKKKKQWQEREMLQGCIREGKINPTWLFTPAKLSDSLTEC